MLWARRLWPPSAQWNACDWREREGNPRAFDSTRMSSVAWRQHQVAAVGRGSDRPTDPPCSRAGYGKTRGVRAAADAAAPREREKGSPMAVPVCGGGQLRS